FETDSKFNLDKNNSEANNDSNEDQVKKDLHKIISDIGIGKIMQNSKSNSDLTLEKISSEILKSYPESLNAIMKNPELFQSICAEILKNEGSKNDIIISENENEEEDIDLSTRIINEDNPIIELDEEDEKNIKMVVVLKLV
ncbi:MAG: hypothetical protein MHPSP_002319, partial [Paramarteilia canceri]